MLAKLTSKNQLTLPKSVTDSLGPVQYFEVQVQAGQVVLTPVRIQRGDAVRAKLAELDLGDEVFAQALAWAADGRSVATTEAVTGARKTRATRKSSAADAKAGQTDSEAKRLKARQATKPVKAKASAVAVKTPEAVARSMAKPAGKVVKASTRLTSSGSAGAAKAAAKRGASSKARRSAA